MVAGERGRDLAFPDRADHEPVFEQITDGEVPLLGRVPGNCAINGRGFSAICWKQAVLVRICVE